MRRLIISDLHMGSLFSRENKILKLLTEEEFDELILGGDIIDFIKVPKFTKTSLEIFNILSNLSVPIIYIIGNHDLAFSEFEDQTLLNLHFMKRYDFTDNNKKIRVEHGDDYDNSIVKWEYLMLLISLIGNIIERYLRIDTDKLLSYWEKYRNKARDKVDSINILKKNTDVDIFVMGHTHRPDIVETTIDEKQMVYANSGDWVQHSTYLIVENGKVDLKFM